MDFADFSWWKLIYWGIGTFGVAGTIALAVFAPAVFQGIAAVVVRLMRRVLSTRLGCAVLAAIVAAVIADYVRHSIEDDRRAAENAAFEKAQAERDKRIAQETRELVWKEIADATAQNAVIDKDVKDFTDALPKPPPETGNPFRVGADACRLRHIAGQGQAQCGSERSEGVPTADTAAASLRDRIRKRLPGGSGGSPRRSEEGQ